MLANFILLLALPIACLSAKHPSGSTFAGSTFAGSTSSFNYPPNATSVPETYFPDAAQVGFAGPTPTGDEAAAIETAPSLAKVNNVYPLVAPGTADHNTKKFNVPRYWGNLSPMYSVDSFGLPKASAQIPAGCELKQVHLLHRHGARYPTGGAGPADLAKKIHAAATGGGFSATGVLEFLNTWVYRLGAELLTPFGRQELFDLGVAFRVQYGDLLKGFSDLPVFRTTSQDRMVDSALNFAAGFFGVRTYITDYHQLITVEASGINNTLAPYFVCPNANNEIGAFGGVQAAKWIAVYLAPATKRLGSMIKGVNLTATDLFDMQMTCAYETVALGYSKFCDLFTEDEWKAYEYAWDIWFWYSYGPGSPTNAAQGIGYVQELVSRLTQTRIMNFNTSVNGTTVSDKIIFPLNQPIFVDATHDVAVTAVLTALNFTSLAANGPLPTDHIPDKQSYIVSQLAPFATRLVAQVLSCPASGDATHIRFVLNDAVLPMTGIKGCKEDQNGLCPFPTFISAMHERIGEVDYAFDCFANYTIPDPDTIIDGRYPASLRN